MIKAKENIDPKNCLVIVQIPYVVKSEIRNKYIKELHDDILKQKETGVIVLSGEVNILVVPKDTDIQVIDGSQKIQLS